jgi:hypothetical protein
MCDGAPVHFLVHIKLLNSKFGSMWKETVVASFGVVFEHFPRNLEENHEEPIKRAGSPAEILTVHPPNTSNNLIAFASK